MPRLRLALAAAAACLLVPAAPSAHAQKGPKEVLVDATFTFDYTTTWKQPANWSTSDCARRVWREGNGEETWHLTTRKPARLAFRVLDGNGGLSPALDEDGRPLRMLVSLAGPQTRRNTSRVWHEAVGTCTFTPFEQRFKGDCGTRLPPMEVMFGWFGTELEARMGGDQTVPERDRRLARFENCPVVYPQGSPGESWRLRPQKLPIGKVLGQRQFGVKDTQTWTQSDERYQGTSTLSWKATFTRVAKAKPKPKPKPKRKPRTGKRRG